MHANKPTHKFTHKQAFTHVNNYVLSSFICLIHKPHMQPYSFDFNKLDMHFRNTKTTYSFLAFDPKSMHTFCILPLPRHLLIHTIYTGLIRLPFTVYTHVFNTTRTHTQTPHHETNIT